MRVKKQRNRMMELQGSTYEEIQGVKRGTLSMSDYEKCVVDVTTKIYLHDRSAFQSQSPDVEIDLSELLSEAMIDGFDLVDEVLGCTRS